MGHHVDLRRNLFVSGLVRALVPVPQLVDKGDPRDRHMWWLCLCLACGGFTCIRAHLVGRARTCGCDPGRRGWNLSRRRRRMR